MVRVEVNDDSAGDHECSWSVSEGACTLGAFDEAACETFVDAVEYVAIGSIIALMLYTAWISNSYALEIEQGIGAGLNAEDDEEAGGAAKSDDTI